MSDDTDILNDKEHEKKNKKMKETKKDKKINEIVKNILENCSLIEREMIIEGIRID